MSSERCIAVTGAEDENTMMLEVFVFRLKCAQNRQSTSGLVSGGICSTKVGETG